MHGKWLHYTRMDGQVENRGRVGEEVILFIMKNKWLFNKFQLSPGSGRGRGTMKVRRFAISNSLESSITRVLSGVD